MPGFTDEEMGIGREDVTPGFTDEEMGFAKASEEAPLEYPTAPVAASLTGAPVVGITPQQIGKVSEWSDKLMALTPIGWASKVVPEFVHEAVKRVPLPSQKQWEETMRSTSGLGIPFGGGAQGMVAPGKTSGETIERQAAFAGALADEAKGLAEFSTSKIGMATMGLGGPVAAGLRPLARTALRRLINAGFTADIAKNVPDQYQQWLVTREQGTPAEQEKADVSLFTSLMMLGGLAGHQAKGVPEIVGRIPETFEKARQLKLERTAQKAAEKIAAKTGIAEVKPEEITVEKPAEAPPVEIISKSTLAGKDQYRVKAPGIGGETIIMVDKGAPLSEVQRIWEERWKEYQSAEKAVVPEEIPEGFKLSEPPEIAKLGTYKRSDTLGNPRGTMYYGTPEIMARWNWIESQEWAKDPKLLAEHERIKNLFGGNPPIEKPAVQAEQQIPIGEQYAGEVKGPVGLVGGTPAASPEALAGGTPGGVRVTEGAFAETQKPETQKVGDINAEMQGQTQGAVIPTPEVQATPSVETAAKAVPTPGGVPTYNPSTIVEVSSKPAEVPKPTETPVEIRAASEAVKPSPAAIANVESVPGAPQVITPEIRKPRTGGILSKWVTATEGRPLGSEAGFITLEPIKEMWDRYIPSVQDTIKAVREIYLEHRKIPATTDARRGVLEWSGKMQTSFNESAHIQREIETKIRNPIRRDAISNWIEAEGDRNILQQRLDATRSWMHPVTGKPHPDRKRLIAGYEAALNLTPEEISIANEIKDIYDILGQRGKANEVLGNFVQNYVTHLWNNLKEGKTRMGIGQRTLKDKFQFAKARTFNTFFDGEQAGFSPKTKDISKLLPMYMHEMNSVIAARQLVAQLSKGKAVDGRPLLAAKGIGIPVSEEKGKATLVLPEIGAEEIRDYVSFPRQPALHSWRWVAKDASGNPVFLKSDLVVHPSLAPHIKAALGKSRIREWYSTKTTATAEIPKALLRSLDWMQSETKRTMLGLLAPFHQVQEGTHAYGHRVNPFWGNPKIDLANNPAQRDAVRHGVMLAPDMASKDMFMEGFRHSGLVSKIPYIGPLADAYSNYLFHDYIPGLKFRTYEKMVERNSHVYRKELANGTVAPDDVKILSAEQVNAAYGHLNYADLGRSPTIQHFMRLALLAPDFLEARMRFTGQAVKGVAGQKVGREQIIALGFLAASQATAAWTMAQLTGGKWDMKDPFAFHVGNRKFTMRSVPEDLMRGAQDPRAFIYARLNPLIGRGTVQYLSKTDWRGRKVTGTETLKELAMQPLPLTLRALFDVANSPLSPWEQLLASSGIVIKRYSARSELIKKAHDWMADSTDPKIKEAEERFRRETFDDSAYKPLREALINNNYNEAAKEYAKLLETRAPDQIVRTMTHSRPITGNKAWDLRFKASLSAEDKILWDQAIKEQKELMNRFVELSKSIGSGMKQSITVPLQAYR